jgi:hypothetical protein
MHGTGTGSPSSRIQKEGYRRIKEEEVLLTFLLDYSSFRKNRSRNGPEFP